MGEMPPDGPKRIILLVYTKACYNIVMDSIVHFENDQFAGRTDFSPALLADAAYAAANRVEGVAAIRPDLGFSLRNWLRRGAWRRGLVIRPYGYNTIVVEVCLVTRQGYSAADISYRVQESILNAFANQGLTDKKIKRVDVRIAGVAPQVVASVNVEGIL